jgi:hypothetical protein
MWVHWDETLVLTEVCRRKPCSLHLIKIGAWREYSGPNPTPNNTRSLTFSIEANVRQVTRRV